MLKYLLFLSLLLTFEVLSQEYNPPTEKRGIVLYPSDIISVGSEQWVSILKQSDINLLGIHADSRFETLPKLKTFVESKEGQILFKECYKNGVDVEFELHILQDILARSLFDTHPAYFRMDENGIRQKEYNMCFTSEGAYLEIEKKTCEILEWLHPTTHRYFFWTDDVQDAFCHCEKCKGYSESDPA